MVSILPSLEARRVIRVALIASLLGLSYILFQFIIIRVFFYRVRSILLIVSLFFTGLGNITISMIIIYFVFFYLLSFNLTNLLNLATKYLTSHRNNQNFYLQSINETLNYNYNAE